MNNVVFCSYPAHIPGLAVPTIQESLTASNFSSVKAAEFTELLAREREQRSSLTELPRRFHVPVFKGTSVIDSPSEYERDLMHAAECILEGGIDEEYGRNFLRKVPARDWTYLTSRSEIPGVSTTAENICKTPLLNPYVELCIKQFSNEFLALRKNLITERLLSRQQFSDFTAASSQFETDAGGTNTSDYKYIEKYLEALKIINADNRSKTLARFIANTEEMIGVLRVDTSGERTKRNPFTRPIIVVGMYLSMFQMLVGAGEDPAYGRPLKAKAVRGPEFNKGLNVELERLKNRDTEANPDVAVDSILNRCFEKPTAKVVYLIQPEEIPATATLARLKLHCTQLNSFSTDSEAKIPSQEVLRAALLTYAELLHCAVHEIRDVGSESKAAETLEVQNKSILELAASNPETTTIDRYALCKLKTSAEAVSALLKPIPTFENENDLYRYYRWTIDTQSSALDETNLALSPVDISISQIRIEVEIVRFLQSSHVDIEARNVAAQRAAKHIATLMTTEGDPITEEQVHLIIDQSKKGFFATEYEQRSIFTKIERVASQESAQPLDAREQAKIEILRGAIHNELHPPTSNDKLRIILLDKGFDSEDILKLFQQYPTVGDILNRISETKMQESLALLKKVFQSDLSAICARMPNLLELVAFGILDERALDTIVRSKDRILSGQFEISTRQMGTVSWNPRQSLVEQDTAAESQGVSEPAQLAPHEHQMVRNLVGLAQKQQDETFILQLAALPNQNGLISSLKVFNSLSLPPERILKLYRQMPALMQPTKPGESTFEEYFTSQYVPSMNRLSIQGDEAVGDFIMRCPRSLDRDIGSNVTDLLRFYQQHSLSEAETRNAALANKPLVTYDYGTLQRRSARLEQLYTAHSIPYDLHTILRDQATLISFVNLQGYTSPTPDEVRDERLLVSLARLAEKSMSTITSQHVEQVSVLNPRLFELVVRAIYDLETVPEQFRMENALTRAKALQDSFLKDHKDIGRSVRDVLKRLVSERGLSDETIDENINSKYIPKYILSR